ncbi:hypothetical protein F4813DRAFT_351140 [Daldinia decipiens]|uniref:uncharacterized protein n=1 Tax=Daldinia decipiens TaxID=326647 RepID=UPI0020C57912|nr:uncharacterized protein F4813DRAFT_351140 [Daldinia decipiens]KAI1660159.1 hypothetical protein F4813DRAFT_351140 [Daldinia decipiens]
MRLACINDSGEVVDIAAAIAKQPFQARSLLLDSLFSSFQLLPGSPDFFHTEHAIRDALVKVQGQQERYVRTYILTRSLDIRTEKTPRANLIHASFNHGGPIALLGIFYATFDAHRNTRSRETLDYLVNRASEESRLELIYRTNTFPHNPSVVGWLERIFDKFDSDTQGLACILQWLGTSNIPVDIFRRARVPSLSWGADGEVTGISTRIISLVKDEEKLATATWNLDFSGFSKSRPPVIDINRRVAELLKHRLQTATWLPKVAKIIFHAIPKYAPAGPEENCVQICESLMPHVALILSHLDDTQVGILRDQMDLGEVVESCLSMSYFRDKHWKMQAISVATRAINALQDNAVTKTLLQARVDARRYFLSVLYPDSDIDGNQEEQTNVPVVDCLSNAFAAALAITRARRCVQLNQLSSALNHLDNHVFLNNNPPSTLEILWKRRMALMRARILRFEGHFQQAHDILLDLPQHIDAVWVLLSTVLSELGRYDEAIEMLKTRNPTQEKTSLRAQLSLAHAYLLKCMHASLGGQVIDQISLQMSGDIYERLCRHHHPSNYFEKMDYYLSILMGLAAVKHMSGQADAALLAWKKALYTSMDWLPTGYTDMIISYSISELESRRECYIMADAFAGQASMLFSKTGRQHHFPGLGSLWPDIIGHWRFSRGQDPIILQ